MTGYLEHDPPFLLSLLFFYNLPPLYALFLSFSAVRNGTHPDFLKAMQDFTYLSELKLQCATILSAQTKATAKKEHKAEANALSAKGKATRQETRKRMIEEVEMEKQKCIDWYNTVKIDTDMMNGRSGRQTRRRVQRVRLNVTLRILIL